MNNLIKLSITYIIVITIMVLFDYISGGPIDWGINIFLPLFLIGIICLYGGLLDLWTRNQRGLK